MTEPPVPDAVLPGPLPWFLQEPSIHSDATPLALHAASLLGQQGQYVLYVLDSGPLRLEQWVASAQHVTPGLGVWWDGRCVLLATTGGEVWLYHAGAAWQTALYALVCPGGNLVHTSQSFGANCAGILAEQRDAPSVPRSTPVWTGNPVVPGSMPIRQPPATLQDIINDSTFAFERRLREVQ